MSFLRVFRLSSLRQFQSIPLRRQAPRQVSVTAGQRRTFFKNSASDDAAQQQANEKASEIMTKFMQSEEWKKIALHPPAVVAIEKFMETIKSKGLDLQPNQAPKMTEMMKLALDPNFRTALQNMRTEFKNAGVDIENPDFMKNIMGSSSSGSKGLFPWSK